MSSAGDFLRRAAGGVTSTLAQASSTVSQVAQGRKRHEVASDALEKCTLTIKCTPNKDAVTTSALAIKSGYLMKRNEQGQWQRRYICTVPHLFLYYFDSDSSDAPRGVIDLELYTNISRNKSYLKVSPTNEEKLRSFHFQCDDNETLNDWLTHFMRDRYFAVCDERNAYQQMQTELTAVLDTISCQTKAVEIDKDIVEQQLKEALMAKQQAMGVLQNMLVIVGITEEESAQLQDINRLAECLETHVRNLKRELETKFFGPDEALESEKAARKAEVSALQEAIDLEIKARKNVEAMLLKLKKAEELRAQEMQSEIDTLQLNFQLLLGAKTEADSKCATLADQKKMLVKECKRLRAQLTEAENNLERVEGVNTKFTQSVTSLQAQLRTAQSTIDQLTQQAQLAEQKYQQREQAAVTAAVVAALDAVTLGSHATNTASTAAENKALVDNAATKGALQPTIGVQSDDSNETLPTASSGVSAGHSDEAAPASAVAMVVAESAEHAGAAEAVEGSEGQSTTTTAEVLTADQVSALLLESQAVMASLRPLPGGAGGGRVRSSRSTGGADTPTGTISTSNSGSNLAGGQSGRERLNSTDSVPASPLDKQESSEHLHLHDRPKTEVEAQYRYLGNSNTTAATATESPRGDSLRRDSHSSNCGSGGGGGGGEGRSAEEEYLRSGAASAASAASAAAALSMSMLSGAMTMLSSTASSVQGTSSSGGSGGSSGGGGETGTRQPAKGIISAMAQASDPSGEDPGQERDDAERLPSAMRLNCLRCGGTVEGPKFSTCKCSVPALVPEDLQAAGTTAVEGNNTPSSGSGKSSWGLSGMFTRGSTVFKEGLAKASQVTASNVGSLMQITKAAASSGSSSSAATAEPGSTTPTQPADSGRKEGYLFYNTVVSSPSPRSPASTATAAEGGNDSAPSTDVVAGQAETKVAPEKELWGYIMGSSQPSATPAKTECAGDQSASTDAADAPEDAEQSSGGAAMEAVAEVVATTTEPTGASAAEAVGQQSSVAHADVDEE